ncbi:inositol 1,4,5-trisphosphate receptor-interacting protein-like 1 [Monodelphis domestica]|uniref:inositol 1,4,5-trisphosphate receptor-interacting protein-like 1 n=1 Tax=Monodelphis domestica TaxID=13616 RepID=UPI0004435056|nr:inositol 1,4,5-trisphosphate receptor-interacting protein-like 1 [Monodelphis domestica]
MAMISFLFVAVMYVVQHLMFVSDRMDLATLARSRQLEKVMIEEMRQLELEFEKRTQEEKMQEEAWKPLGIEEEKHETIDKEKSIRKNKVRREESEKVQVFQTESSPGPVGWMLGNLWNAGLFGLFLLFELLRQNMQQEPSFDSSSDEEEEEFTGETVNTACTWLSDFPKQEDLDSFLEQNLENNIRDLPSTCEFVESFVDDLIETCQIVGRKELYPQLEDCLGIGPAFEKWGIGQDVHRFDVLVPLSPPQNNSFHVDMRTPESGLLRCGRVRVESECVCKREKLLGDVICLVHHWDHSSRPGKPANTLKNNFCTGSNLDVFKSLYWFRSMIGKAWALVAHKYDFKLSLPSSATSCKLRLDYRSGRFLLINLILGVQRDDTLIYFVSQSPEQEKLTSVDWPESFAACEHLFLKLVGRFAPENTCHLKCLQVISYLQSLKAPPHGLHQPILTPYHFKTALMHLLLRLPLTEWKPELFPQRLQDILWYLGRGLQERCLYHFLIGNTFLPLTIPVPKNFRSVKPFNLFRHLELDSVAHSKAVTEFHDLVTQVKSLSGLPIPGRVM